MRAIDLLGGSEVIGKDDCWELLETAHIGRLVATVGGRVEIFPVNYALEGETILFRTNAGRKMRAALGIEVVFEVDDVDPTSRTGWSVIARGQARDITRFDCAERLQALQPWTGRKDFLVRITPWEVTGRRVQPLESA